MKRFRNLLYIIDDEIPTPREVNEKVATLAQLNNAHVTVVRLLEESLMNQLTATVFGADSSLRDQALQKAGEELETLLNQPLWHDLNSSSAVLQGKGFLAVTRSVLKEGYDLVIKANTATVGVDPLAMRLMRKCPCPVWVLNPTHTGPIKKILAAVDITSDDIIPRQLNVKIIELANSLAQREGGEAHYLHAWYLQSETMLRGPRFKFDDSGIERMKEQLRAESIRKMNELLSANHIHPTPDRMHNLEGRADQVISQVINTMKIDMLVIGTLGRSGIPGLLIGNTAEQLLAQLTCSVLAVKPDGFVSPITLD